jgi:hypothetical protein
MNKRARKNRLLLWFYFRKNVHKKGKLICNNFLCLKNRVESLNTLAEISGAEKHKSVFCYSYNIFCNVKKIRKVYLPKIKKEKTLKNYVNFA